MKWISVTERLPEMGKAVIVCQPCGKNAAKVEQGYRDLGGWWRVYGTKTKRVTHWMPMPMPPKAGDGS